MRDVSRTGRLFLSAKQGTDLFEVVLRLLRVKPLFLTPRNLTLTLTNANPTKPFSGKLDDCLRHIKLRHNLKSAERCDVSAPRKRKP